MKYLILLMVVVGCVRRDSGVDRLIKASEELADVGHECVESHKETVNTLSQCVTQLEQCVEAHKVLRPDIWENHLKKGGEPGGENPTDSPPGQGRRDQP